MNFENIKGCVFEAAKEAGIAEYEIFYTSDTAISAETLKDEISSFTYGVSGGICFRCVIDGKMGSASTELLEEEELRAIVKRAASNAGNIESDDPAIIFKGSEKYEKLTAKVCSMPAAAKIKNNALAIQKDTYAQSEYVTEGTQSYVFAGESEMRLVNSYGLDLSNKYSAHGAYVQAVVNKDGEAEEHFEAFEAIELDELAGLSEKAVNGALAKLGAVGQQPNLGAAFLHDAKQRVVTADQTFVRDGLNGEKHFIGLIIQGLLYRGLARQHVGLFRDGAAKADHLKGALGEVDGEMHIVCNDARRLFLHKKRCHVLHGRAAAQKKRFALLD